MAGIDDIKSKIANLQETLDEMLVWKCPHNSKHKPKVCNYCYCVTTIGCSEYSCEAKAHVCYCTY